MTGKKFRMGRIADRSGNMLIVPMDHGVTMGALDGMIDMDDAVHSVSRGGATAVLMHKGMISRGRSDDRVGRILHMSASTNISNGRKVLVATVEEAIKAGVDAVSMHVNLGGHDESAMLTDLGAVSRECKEWGMPLMVMSYPYDESLVNDAKVVTHCARAVAELGADIVKVPYTGDIDSFSRLVECTGVPVVIAGGPKISSDVELLNIVRNSMDAGGKGVSIGRNLFQHMDTEGITRAVADIVLNGSSVSEAMEHIS